jgi:Pyridoxamine 5'-phosphate oxidase
MSDPIPSRRLTGDEVLADALVRELLDARLVGVLATFDSRGTIHAVPMWYVRHGDAVLLATSSSSRKVQNLEHDARATFVLHDSRPGFEVCGASIVGTAKVVRSPESRPLVELVHGRYVSRDGAADPAATAFLSSDDVALRFRPSAALTWDERASAAARALRSLHGALPLVPTEPRPSAPSE